jgi:hypothetical protein
MGKRCWKCGTKKKITRHHVYGKYGLCGLSPRSKKPLNILLAWLGMEYDDIDIMFWKFEIIPLCRKCHDKFHIFITKMLRKCDSMESEEPLIKYLEGQNEQRVGSRGEYTYR